MGMEREKSPPLGRIQTHDVSVFKLEGLHSNRWPNSYQILDSLRTCLIKYPWKPKFRQVSIFLRDSSSGEIGFKNVSRHSSQTWSCFYAQLEFEWNWSAKATLLLRLPIPLLCLSDRIASFLAHPQLSRVQICLLEKRPPPPRPKKE